MVVHMYLIRDDNRVRMNASQEPGLDDTNSGKFEEEDGVVASILKYVWRLIYLHRIQARPSALGQQRSL